MFQKIGQQRKIKGTIYNVPVDCETVCHGLPRPPETSGIILLKLKRKLEYKGYQYYQPVCPEFLQEALEYLKSNNELYYNINISINNIDTELMTSAVSPKSDSNCTNDHTNGCTADTSKANVALSKELISTNPIFESGSNEDAENVKDLQNNYQVSINETFLQSCLQNYSVDQITDADSLIHCQRA